ncbi:MAG TPA: DUF4350 domain-containing protein [Anaerolineales bacterium]
MNRDLRRFAPLGLYLALIAAVAAIGLYFVQRAWNLPLQISLGLIVVGLALFAFLDPERTRVALTGRQARYGSNALVMSVAFIGILVVINYLVYQNSKRWDLTEDKQFTLAPETLSTLDKLPASVKAEAFFTAQTSPDTAKGLLDQYKFRSKGKFDYQFIDPNQNPVAAQTAKITQDGSVVLTMNGQQQIVTSVNEQNLTGALVRLINPVNRVVYFLTGHGEANPDDTGQKGFSDAKTVLESKNYSVKTLNLLSTNNIPADAKAIVVAGPTKPVSANEVTLLDQYVKNGGSLIVMEDSPIMTEFGDAADPLADYLTNTWGMTLEKDFVLDSTSQQSLSLAIGVQYGNHPITDKLTSQGMATIFPTARSITLKGISGGQEALALVTTSQNAWGKTDLVELQKLVQTQGSAAPTPDQKVDKMGPLALAAAIQTQDGKSHVAVFGDADFAANQFYTQYGNGDLFVNSIDWAVGQEQLINLTPKQTTTRLLVPPQRISMNLIALGTVILIPGLTLLAGVLVFFQRRRRG